MNETGDAKYLEEFTDTFDICRVQDFIDGGADLCDLIRGALDCIDFHLKFKFRSFLEE